MGFNEPKSIKSLLQKKNILSKSIKLKKKSCNSRVIKSHMRLKKSRPYNHWLKSQGHILLRFSTSSGRSQFGSLAT